MYYFLNGERQWPEFLETLLRGQGLERAHPASSRSFTFSPSSFSLIRETSTDVTYQNLQNRHQHLRQTVRLVGRSGKFQRLGFGDGGHCLAGHTTITGRGNERRKRRVSIIHKQRSHHNPGPHEF